MLILGRRVGETLCVYPSGKNNSEHLVKIRILGVRGSQARIGIEAPPSISVHREEVYERILLENNNNN